MRPYMHNTQNSMCSWSDLGSQNRRIVSGNTKHLSLTHGLRFDWGKTRYVHVKKKKKVSSSPDILCVTWQSAQNWFQISPQYWIHNLAEFEGRGVMWSSITWWQQQQQQTQDLKTQTNWSSGSLLICRKSKKTKNQNRFRQGKCHKMNRT